MAEQREQTFLLLHAVEFVRRKNSLLSLPLAPFPTRVLSPFETRRATETNTRVVVVVSKVRNDKLRSAYKARRRSVGCNDTYFTSRGS